jgi:hypothetical protein
MSWRSISEEELVLDKHTLVSLEKRVLFDASAAPFLCLIFDHLLCPDSTIRVVANNLVEIGLAGSLDGPAVLAQALQKRRPVDCM